MNNNLINKEVCINGREEKLAMKDIVEIWNENGKKLPIKVARRNWRTNGYAEIISIKEKEYNQNRRRKKKRYEVLAKVHNGAEKIGNNFTAQTNGIYKVNIYDYKNWYLIQSD